MWNRMTSLGIACWFIAGALVGLGLILIYSVGVLILVAGIVMALYSFRKVGQGQFWAALTGMGIAPASLLMFQYLTSHQCSPGQSIIVLASGEAVPCTSFAPGYLYIMAFFGLVALIGIVWGVVKLLRNRAYTT